MYRIQLGCSLSPVHGIRFSLGKKHCVSKEEDYKMHEGPNWAHLNLSKRDISRLNISSFHSEQLNFPSQLSFKFASACMCQWEEREFVRLDYSMSLYSVAPTNGNWGPWTSYGACSKTCNGGKQLRRRLCNNPAPKDGGRKCVGNDIEERGCNKHSCKGKSLTARW